jgi:Carbohydrate-binding family 9
MIFSAPEVRVPRWRVPRSPVSWDPAADLAAWKWEEVPSLPAFTLADGSGPAVQQTRVRVCWDGEALYVHLDCEDRDAWGTYRRRDDPLWEEEAVEVFLAPGEADPARYFEFEVSLLGVLFDARIHNPTSRRIDMTGDPSWDCPGLRWAAGPGAARQDWWAALSIPWSGLVPAGRLPRIWRANFYRIERPRDGEPEFSGWSPTLTRPADFHKPARFGVLELEGSSSR